MFDLSTGERRLVQLMEVLNELRRRRGEPLSLGTDLMVPSS